MVFAKPHPEARRFVPEVVQTSFMDCGPATVMSLVKGFGLSANYDMLREACKTERDGTSISTIDEVANQIGLETEECMVPLDHILRPEANALPAIAVTVDQSHSIYHFIVIWSVVGPMVQIMDPRQGRAWVSKAELMDMLHNHIMPVPAADWREWAATDEFQRPLDARMAELGLSRGQRKRLRDAAIAVEDWRGVAALDAATRMVNALVRDGGIRRGEESHHLLEKLAVEARTREAVIPDLFWTVWSVPEGGRTYRSPGQAPRTFDSGDGPESVLIHGVIAVRALGKHARPPDTASLPPELAAAIVKDEEPPARAFANLILQDGRKLPGLLFIATAFAAALVILEAVLLRGLLGVGNELELMSQRAFAIAAFVAALVLVSVLELFVVKGALTAGRFLDTRIRMAFFDKIPKLSNRYFQSRPLSDIAARGHELHLLRGLPLMAVEFWRGVAQLVFTAIGIIWLDPDSAILAVSVALVCVVLPLLLQPMMTERDLRMRNHSGALGHFFLDALLGMTPVHVHGVQDTLKQEQESMLVHWARAGFQLHSTITWIEGLLALLGYGLAIVMVFSMVERDASGLLLLVYWTLSLPALGRQVTLATRQYPAQRNIVLRMLEPLRALDESQVSTPTGAGSQTRPGRDPQASRAVGIEFVHVSVKANGYTILDDVEVSIKPGSHVAIVGYSGAGKSSLVGLLLGGHQATSGQVLVDNRPLCGEHLQQLRQSTAWVDPSVQLWNTTFLENLLYGVDKTQKQPIAEVLDQSALRSVLEKLPNGLQTELGEGGTLVSGGEGQRVRFGRAMMRRDARLVILDEPFRSLDRPTREKLLANARAWWPHATLIWVSHDIEATYDFERVLVMKQGRIVEDGVPRELLKQADTHYAGLARNHAEVRRKGWSGPEWRRIRLENGVLKEGDPS